MPKIAPCGKKCEDCLAYAKNLIYDDRRKELVYLIKKYYNLDIPIERLYCDGCKGLPFSSQRFDKDCRVRACAKKNKKKHCGACENYPCETFMSKKGLSLKEAMDIAGDEFNEIEYKEVLKPYDNKTRLDVYKLTGKIPKE